MPQVMAVPIELRHPLTHTETRERRPVICAFHSRDCPKGKPQKQHSSQSLTDHISAEVLVRNAEIRQETHRAAASRTTETVHPNLLAPATGKNHPAQIETMPMHTPRTAIKWTAVRSWRREITPPLGKLLVIYAERTKLSAWFRRWLFGLPSFQILFRLYPIPPRNLLDNLSRISRNIKCAGTMSSIFELFVDDRNREN